MPRRGLPVTLKMRHDEHYVEALESSAGRPIGRMIPIEEVDPNPDQPRQVMGDLSELISSVSEKGIIEPLIVRHKGSRFQIVAGERRYQAAVQAGIKEVPVVIRDVDDVELIELALVENLQRKDLSPFEESEAIHLLAKKFGHTHEGLARRLGKSRTSITEILTLSSMPEEVKNLCRLADIRSKSLLLQVVRQPDAQKMIAFIEKITSDGPATRKKARGLNFRARKGRPRSYIFKYLPSTKAFNLRLSFRKHKVERGEVITALESIISDLKKGKKL